MKRERITGLLVIGIVAGALSSCAYYRPHRKLATERSERELQAARAYDDKYWQDRRAETQSRQIEVRKPEIPRCLPIINFLDNVALRIGIVPKPDCRYALRYMIPVQKTSEGYLFTEDPAINSRFGSGSGGGIGVAFLRTGRSLSQDTHIKGEVAYDGPFSYVGLDGFEKKVFAFRFVDEK